MMTLEQYKEQYKGMSAAEVRGLIARSADFRTETEKLYRSIYHKPLNKSCGDCWIDAYVLIMRGDPVKLQAMMKKRYDLRAGAVLVDPKDPTKTATKNNITDELAIYHLRIHPTCKRLFNLLPENWEEEVYGKPEDNSDLDGMSAEEKAVFEGYKRADRDRIREIMAGACTPKEALDKLTVLEEEGYHNAALRLRPEIDKAIAQEEADIAAAKAEQERAEAEAAEKAAREAAEKAEKEKAEAETAEAERLAKEKAAAEAAGNAGAPADGANAEAPADAPAEEEKATEGKENKKGNTKK